MFSGVGFGVFLVSKLLKLKKFIKMLDILDQNNVYLFVI